MDKRGIKDHINNLNIFERDKLTLLQALDLNATDKYEFEAPPINESVLQGELPPIDNIYDYALKKFPDIREQEKRIESARYGWKASRAMLYPTLTFTASLYSSYSSNGVLKSFVTGPEKTPYFEQMKLNRGEFIALTLSIPVFNNYKAATNAQTAKINLQNTEIEYLKQRNNLIKKIQQAWLDASGARAKYDASEMQLQSLSENFTFAETRYEKGVIDFYTYIEILNNKTAAEVQKLNAGYDYILKLKILDLYQGKPLKF